MLCIIILLKSEFGCRVKRILCFHEMLFVNRSQVVLIDGEDGCYEFYEVHYEFSLGFFNSTNVTCVGISNHINFRCLSIKCLKPFTFKYTCKEQ